MPTALPDTAGTLVCALGLVLGLGGFLGGITLIITGTCLSSTPRCSGGLGEEGGDLHRMGVEDERFREGSRDKQRGGKGVRLEGGGQRKDPEL